jgi:hypothetical protein
MGLLSGAMAGAVAAMSMTGLRQVTTSLGIVKRTPPEAAVQTAAPEMLTSLPPERQQAAIELAHWAYGAAGGVAYAFLPDRLRGNLLIGLAYGAGSWAVFESVVAPRIGQKREGGRQQDAALLADHLLYGGVLSRLAR